MLPHTSSGRSTRAKDNREERAEKGDCGRGSKPKKTKKKEIEMASLDQQPIKKGKRTQRKGQLKTRQKQGGSTPKDAKQGKMQKTSTCTKETKRAGKGKGALEPAFKKCQPKNECLKDDDQGTQLDGPKKHAILLK